MRSTIFKRASVRRTRDSSWSCCADEPFTGRLAWCDHEDWTYSSDDRYAFTGNQRVETDGGTLHEADDDTAFTTYVSDAYSYQIEYPVEWIVEADPPSGTFFSAPNGSSPSAFVFVDDETRIGVSLAEYVDSFSNELAVDEYIHDLERQDETAMTLPGGQSGTVVKYTYTDDAPYEQWCGTYCFIIADGTGYTVGVDWEAADEFEESAIRIIDSFALAEKTQMESDAQRESAVSRSSQQRTEDES